MLFKAYLIINYTTVDVNTQLLRESKGIVMFKYGHHSAFVLFFVVVFFTLVTMYLYAQPTNY